MKDINQLNLKKETYALYRRVALASTEELDYQYNLAEKFIAERSNNKLLFDYCEIESASTHYLKRPELKRMLDDARSGVFSTLLLSKRDRLSRDSKEFIQIRYILQQAEVKVIFLDYNELNLEETIYENLIDHFITSIVAIEPK